MTLENSIQENPDTPTPQNDTQKEGNGPAKQTPIISNVVSPPPSKNKSEYYRYLHTPWWKTLAEMIGIGAVVWYASITNNMWKEMQKTTIEATKAATTARQQLELTERPWIKITFSVGVQGFSFQNGSATLPLQAHIQNIGHSVATGVIVPVQMFLAYDENGIFKEPLKRQKDLCDPIAKKPVTEMEYSNMALTIFPGDTDESMNYGLGVGKDELDSAKTLIPQGSGFPKVAGGKRILPIIVGCVDYQYATSERHHQTRFIYEVQRFNRTLPPNMYPIYSIEVPRPVLAADVVLVKYGFGGFLAN